MLLLVMDIAFTHWTLAPVFLQTGLCNILYTKAIGTFSPGGWTHLYPARGAMDGHQYSQGQLFPRMCSDTK